MQIAVNRNQKKQPKNLKDIVCSFGTYSGVLQGEVHLAMDPSANKMPN